MADFNEACLLINFRILPKDDNVQILLEQDIDIFTTTVDQSNYLSVLLSADGLEDCLNVKWVDEDYQLKLTRAINVEVLKRKGRHFLLTTFQRSYCNYGLALSIPCLLDMFLPFYDIVKTMLLRCQEPFRSIQPSVPKEERDHKNRLLFFPLYEGTTRKFLEVKHGQLAFPRKILKNRLLRTSSNRTCSSQLSSIGCGNDSINDRIDSRASKKDCAQELISDNGFVALETTLSKNNCVEQSTQSVLDNTASHNQNLPGCSSGPDQVVSSLKNIRIDGSTEENTAGGKSAANGAGDASNSGGKPLEIEAALLDNNERQKFLDFLNQQYCSENLYFYFSVREYQQLRDDDDEGRCRLGNQIYERHFAPNCNEPVNVEYSTHKAIVDAKRAKNFNPKTYDQAQYQIFHLLKYDVWPRYIRSEVEKRSSRTGCTENDVSSEHSSCGEGTKSVTKRPSVRELRYCMVLSADSLTAEKEVLSDPLISVKRWTETMAQRRGMDKNSTEVVDAQTGSTIDPARQAIDALNNRHVRLMPVVRFPVDFLASVCSSKNTSPMPVKVVMLRVRQGLTLNKVIRPLLIKYNYDPTDVAACFAGTCDPVPMSTTVASITPRMITVMTQQQYKDRKLLPKREYQKELVASPILAQNQELNLPYFQHGDIAFYECPTEIDAKGQKHNAIRSHSTNPRFQELFKFGRKASQAKSKSDNEGNVTGADSLLAAKTGGSDRRKSIGTAGRAAALTPSSVAPSDIPYCGESSLQDEGVSRPSASPKAKKERPAPSTAPPSVRPQQALSKECAPKPNPVPPKPISSEGHCAAPKAYFEMPEFLKEGTKKMMHNATTGANGNGPRVPAIYASAVRSDKEAMSPSEVGADKISWYADYV